MIWLTWRQSRIQAYIAAAALALVAVAMVLDNHLLADLWTNSGAATCTSAHNCTNEISNFVDSARAGLTATLFELSLIFMYVLPPVIGVFWGAPLVARELEAGTHRLVWNQSVTPQRWLAIKLATLGLTCLAVTAVVSALVTWGARLLDDNSMNPRIGPALFSGRGIAPVAYTAFAFALGVAAGLLLRRTVPAMAATLGVYVAALLAVAFGLRAHLLPARHLTSPLTRDTIRGFGIGPGSDGRVLASTENIQGWVLSNDTMDASGHPFRGPFDPSVCNRDRSPQDCLNWIINQHLQRQVSYHPESQFWPLQFAESGIFLAAAALLVGFTFWWLRRRRTA
jgi:ABC-2 family transporter protein